MKHLRSRIPGELLQVIVNLLKTSCLQAAEPQHEVALGLESPLNGSVTFLYQFTV